MRVFIDACVDPGIVEILVGHEVRTAFDVGWQNLKDHILLPKVAAEFDVFLTADKGFEFEHNLYKLPVGIVIAHVTRNKLANYRTIAPLLLEALQAVKAGEVRHVRADD
jgi:hypothetical protein